MTIPEGRAPITDKDLADLTRRQTLPAPPATSAKRKEKVMSDAPDRIWAGNDGFSNRWDWDEPVPDWEEYIRTDLYEALRAENVRLREEVEYLKNPPKRYCAKCGHPEDNHPYRHPFVALETKKAPGDDAGGQ